MEDADSLLGWARGSHLTKVISDLYGPTPRERIVTEFVLQGRHTKA